MTITRAYEQLPDETLVQRVLSGETMLFELLVRRHNQRLFRAARSILSSDQAAEDAVQEAHITAFTKPESFGFRARYSTWLTRIVVRQALTARRRPARRHETTIPHLRLESTMPNSDPSPESHVSNSQIGRVIEQALDEIPDDFRTVFVLREVEGMSTSEVAEVLEIAEGTVKTRLFRGKHRLRALLEGRIDGALTEVHEFAGARCDRITHNIMGAIVRRVP